MDLNRKVTQDELKRQKQILEDSRNAVTQDLASLPPTDFRMSFLPQLRGIIQARLDQLTPQIQSSIQNAQQTMGELTLEQTNELITASGIDISLLPSMADPELVKATQTLTGELITTVPQTLRQKTGNVIAIGIMQQKGVNDIIDDVRTVYNQTVSNAERITRTEVMRTQSLVQNNRYAQIVEFQPGLLKTWRWSHLPDGRSCHMEAELTYSVNPIPFRDPFMVAPTSGARKEPMQFPRDPI